MTLTEFLVLPLEDKVDGKWLSGVEGEGEHIECYNNGQKFKHCNYKNGELHGEYRRWEKNGQIREHCFYKNGVLHGERKWWWCDGDIIGHYVYENGTIIKKLLG